MGFVETLLGSPHVSERGIEVGVIVVHTSFTPALRASVIALGFLVLSAWGLARLGRSVLASVDTGR